MKLLCGNCEQRFSRWERANAELVKRCCDESPPYEYGESFGWYSLSLVWRTLRWAMEHQPEYRQTPGAQRAVEAAELLWRRCLLGDGRKLPSVLYTLVLGSASTPSPAVLAQLPPYWNRYLDGVNDITIATSHVSAFRLVVIAYAKVGPLVTIGFVKHPKSEAWEGMRIRTTGILDDGSSGIPEALLRFMSHRASLVGANVAKMSGQKRKKMSEILTQMDEPARKARLKALSRDVEMFGREAVFGHREDS